MGKGPVQNEDEEALELTRRAFTAAAELTTAMTATLALAVSERGTLDLTRFQARESDAFWLSLMLARLQAGRSILGFAVRRESRLPIAMARLFIAELVQDLAAELAFKSTHWGLSQDIVQAALFDPRTATFLARTLDAAFYQQVGEMVLGETQAELGLDREREAMRQKLRRFAERKVVPVAQRLHRDDQTVPREIIEAVAALGCFGLSIPERYGGHEPAGRDNNVARCIVTEELARGSLGVAGGLITRPETLASALLKGGTDEQKETWLPLLATGEKRCAVSVTEPDFGSDVTCLEVRATPVEDGWVLDGTQTWCTFAGLADVLMVLARSDGDLQKGQQGLTIFLVEKPRFEGHAFAWTQPKRGDGGAGTISAQAVATIGYRGMHTFEVCFSDFFVPEQNVLGGLGGLGKGLYYQMEGFAAGRLQTAARATGVMQAALEAALRCSAERRACGVPIASHPLTKWKLAKIATLTQVARQFTYDVAGLIDVGKGQTEAAMAKLWASRQAEWVAREAMQLHGAAGYAEASTVSRYFVDARMFSLFEGVEEVLALKVVARQVLQRLLDERKARVAGAGEEGI